MSAEHDKLREAISRARKDAADRFHRSLTSCDDLELLADAAESTLPKTKMVDVWRVEWATSTGIVFAQHFTMENNAHIHARNLREDGMDCIRVTGPHMQEIPA